ncbi:MAG: DNA polymerase III subunit gamma/tau [Betaproteobacteria bacterium]|nr:DNA polymerase III subunit gamma/tau [Betaproteobacteria bacterium]
MAHQVLARKWRPRNFADVIGQDHVVRALTNALDTGRIHHAYLFTGTRGVGKTTLARILAKALNCETGVTSKPCGVCTACMDIDAGRFVDLMEVDAATNTKVDEMRELLETAQYAPVSGRYKVYIIDEVHMLSKSAFNAMLKTLEEPPGHVEFILATTDPQKLPITVLSRCLQFNLKNLSPPLIVEHLSKILGAEKISFEKPALEMLSRAAEGSVRDSLSLLDQAIAYGAGEVKADHVAAMLGALDQTYLFSMLDCLVNRDAKGLVAEIEQLAARSVSFDITLKDLGSLLSRVALVQSVGDGADDGPDATNIQRLATALKPDKVQLFYQIALLGRRDLSLAPDEQSGFTMTLLRMLAFAGGAADAVTTGGDTAPDTERSSERKVAASGEAKYGVERQNTSAGALSRAKVSQEPVSTRTLSEKYVNVEAPEVGKAKPSIGDWPTFVAGLNLSGLAGMLAKQCEFKSFVDGVLELILPGAQKHLADKAYQEKLKSELLPHLGANLRLNIRVGDVSGVSLAAHEDRERAQQQKAAEIAIDEDPFIKHLKQDFGADVVRSSIRPANS